MLNDRPIIINIPTELLQTYTIKNVTSPPSQRLKLEWVYVKDVAITSNIIIIIIIIFWLIVTNLTIFFLIDRINRYGYRGKDCRHNLYLLPTGEIVYFMAAVVVLYNVDDQIQRHYTGHTSEIRCLTIHPNKLLIATGQAANNEWSVSRIINQYFVLNCDHPSQSTNYLFLSLYLVGTKRGPRSEYGIRSVWTHCTSSDWMVNLIVAYVVSHSPNWMAVTYCVWWTIPTIMFYHFGNGKKVPMDIVYQNRNQPVIQYLQLNFIQLKNILWLALVKDISSFGTLKAVHWWRRSAYSRYVLH